MQRFADRLGADGLLADQARCQLRESRREVLANHEAHRADLAWPILAPALRQIREEHGPIRVTFRVSNQPPVRRHHATDNLHLGAILASLLQEAGLCQHVALAVWGLETR